MNCEERGLSKTDNQHCKEMFIQLSAY